MQFHHDFLLCNINKYPTSDKFESFLLLDVRGYLLISGLLKIIQASLNLSNGDEVIYIKFYFGIIF